MGRIKTTMTLLFLGILLLLIRFFEKELFYDPLIIFFKSDYNSQSIPEINTVSFILHTFFRYTLNSLISIAIIWLVFNDKGILKMSSMLYGVLFLLLLGPYLYLVFSANTTNYLPLFYIRRFIIQPLFLLLLIPAFYFQKKK